MKKTLTVFSLFVFVAVILLAAPRSWALDPACQKIYESKCQSCHGWDALEKKKAADAGADDEAAGPKVDAPNLKNTRAEAKKADFLGKWLDKDPGTKLDFKDSTGAAKPGLTHKKAIKFDKPEDKTAIINCLVK